MTDGDAQRTAERVGVGLLAADRATRSLGMRLVAIAPGTATLAMTVREDMLNGHDTCHGGLIAALADSAFAFACNSHDEATVAAGFAIDFVAPARLGEVLTATARELARGGRSGVYDVEVTNPRGERVALFRGRSHTFRGRPAVGAATGKATHPATTTAADTAAATDTAVPAAPATRPATAPTLAPTLSPTR